MNNEQHIFFYKIYMFHFTKLKRYAIQTVVNLMWGEDLKGYTLYKSRPQNKYIADIINMNQ